MQDVALISHEACLEHEMGAGHPEAPARLRAIHEHFDRIGLSQDLIQERPTQVDTALWRAVHTPELVDTLEAVSPAHGYGQLDPDTAMNPHSLRAARLASGAVIAAIDGIAAGDFDRAFCAIRPPGHHAERELSMGFCLVNHIAVGIHYLRSRQPGVRVAVLDFDVHHGNGTVDIFKGDPDTLVCSSFQHPFYPHRHYDTQAPNLVNSPLAAGTDADAVKREIDRTWVAALQAHRPEWVFISAGFDAHRDDPLGGLCWRDEDYYVVTKRLLQCIDRGVGGRVVSVLEGGYDLRALAHSAEQHVRALMS